MIKKRHVLLGGLGLLWWLTKPQRRDQEMLPWQGNFSHRGLHDKDAPENTRPAFEKSIEHGWGYEFDVQLTKDDQLVIHHDYDGARSFGQDVRLEDLTLAELRQFDLFGTDQHIMTLPELLALTAGRVPIILEIKAEKNTWHISRLVAEVMDDYAGPFVIESFHPFVLAWFRIHRPTYIRGQLSYNAFGRSGKTITNFMLTHYLFNVLARPHFAAHAFEDRNDFGLKLQHWLHQTPLVVYTVQTPREEIEARKMFHTIIFENYRPVK